MSDEEPIQAWVMDVQEVGGTPTKGGKLERGLTLIDVDPQLVRAGLERLRRILPEDDEPTDGTLRRWKMNEVTLSLELSAEAGIQLIGSSQVGVTGAIEVTFTRVEG